MSSKNWSTGTANTDYISYGYGLAVIAGGLIGYLKAKSVPSLAAGLAFGTAATFGAYQTSQNPNNYHIGLITSSVLLGVMGSRFYKSRKFMPAGLIASLSLVQFVRLGMKLVQ
jgi:uncharacterized membrane protein (UPF0136 family)